MANDFGLQITERGRGCSRHPPTIADYINAGWTPSMLVTWGFATKIEENTVKKEYRTKSGLPARIICTDRKGFGQPVVVLVEANAETETLCGYSTDLTYSNTPSAMDLVEVTPWGDFQIDDKVVGGFSPETLSAAIIPTPSTVKGHFAGVSSNGKPLIFFNGKTSYTGNTSEAIEYDFCKKYKE